MHIKLAHNKEIALEYSGNTWIRGRNREKRKINTQEIAYLIEKEA